MVTGSYVYGVDRHQASTERLPQRVRGMFARWNQCEPVKLMIQQYYIRSTRFVLPTLYDALGKGNDPDRMKGALYILWDKGIGQ